MSRKHCRAGGSKFTLVMRMMVWHRDDARSAPQNYYSNALKCIKSANELCMQKGKANRAIEVAMFPEDQPVIRTMLLHYYSAKACVRTHVTCKSARG